MIEQNIYIALFYISGNDYKELNCVSYERASFGEIGWSIHPQVWGVVNKNEIIFTKPTKDDWHNISALGLFAAKEGNENFISFIPIDNINAGSGKAVVIEKDSVFIPIKFAADAQARINSYQVH